MNVASEKKRKLPGFVPEKAADGSSLSRADWFQLTVLKSDSGGACTFLV